MQSTQSMQHNIMCPGTQKQNRKQKVRVPHVLQHEVPVAAVVLVELAVLVDDVDEHHLLGRCVGVAPVVAATTLTPVVTAAADAAVHAAGVNGVVACMWSNVTRRVVVRRRTVYTGEGL